MTRSTALLLGLLLFAPARALAITAGQVDDFENGTTMGWTEGALSPNPPQNVASGGPGGAGDNYLQNVSSGIGTSGSKMVEFNQLQWAGNYTAAGVAAIQMAMVNFGPDPLSMRIAIEGSSTRFGSTTAFSLPADGVWRTATFSLNASSLTLIAGLASLNTVLSGVTTLRVVSAALGPNWNGDTVAATLGVDNIRTLAVSGVEDPGHSVVQLLSNTPNPLASRTVIAYELSRESPVHLEIFDLAGRLVRQLETGQTRSAGSHEVAWDARDDRGLAVMSGVYFYRLQAGSFVQTRRMEVIRG